ncbi:PAF acetylhydrolase family protein [Curvularia clavata]|uniref:1-alkyl-2-acetylglycerophosphocholine esterase n=1 Tax=Curvularia clavata TaxID=95742 RepID=A0A9Q8Z721_CURCL|nr:PAF acetylhydrolase family protein [Curvularia clavata]
MPQKTAEYQGPWARDTFNISADLTPLLLEALLPVCPNNHNSCAPVYDAPIILLSPGYRGSRLYYNVVASAIASEGFMVITMDHPGETNAITYPDGHAVYSDLPNVMDISELAPYAYVRAADAVFVIDQLNNATAVAELLPEHTFQKLPADRVAMLGHSLGGAAAVIAASLDPRIHAVINLDGPFLGSLPPAGLPQPVLFIATEREESLWSETWPELKGPKQCIEVSNLTHEGEDTAYWAGLMGEIAPMQWLHILGAYTKEWVNGAFSGKVGGPLLQGQEPRFPEVTTLSKDNF